METVFAPFFGRSTGVLSSSFVLSLYYGMIDNMGSRQFVGLQNIVETLKNPMFLQAAGNTAVYLGLSIPLILLISLGLAFLLHRGNRTLLFALLVPLVLPSGVTAFFWNAIFSVGGLINKMLYLLGLPLVNWKPRGCHRDSGGSVFVEEYRTYHRHHAHRIQPHSAGVLRDCCRRRCNAAGLFLQGDIALILPRPSFFPD